MPDVGTGWLDAVGGFLGGIGSEIASGLQTAVQGITPIVQPLVQAALQVAPTVLPALLAKPAPRPSAYSPYGYRAAVMPGGAIVPNYSTSPSAALGLVPGGPMQAGIGGDVLQGLGGLFGQYLSPGPAANASQPGYRWPSMVQIQDPMVASRIHTYVRAPMVRYHVSVRPARRRCHRGGR